MFRGAYYPIDYYYYDEKDIYATEDESGDELVDPLADNDCNDIVLKRQRKQIGRTMKVMQEEDQFDVYNDNQTKDDTDDTDDDDDVDYSTTDYNNDSTLGSTLESTYGGGASSYTTDYDDGDRGYSLAESFTTRGTTISRDSC